VISYFPLIESGNFGLEISAEKTLKHMVLAFSALNSASLRLCGENTFRQCEAT
jgi:hypothetical protein